MYWVGSFNPRTHTGCDKSSRRAKSLHRGFQSTHPHGVRRNTLRFKSIILRFNPRTHTGCDGQKQYSALPLTVVSIHAPTRGATRADKQKNKETLFQSTHPHGVRHPPVDDADRGYFGFNPRTHTGCDNTTLLVSGHTKSFNPRTHTGCDWARPIRRYRALRFQSTHPHGVRRVKSVLNFGFTFGFNPRTHTGCDNTGFLSPCRLVCFNPRTHTGCDTSTTRTTTICKYVSIHAPTRGATVAPALSVLP